MVAMLMATKIKPLEEGGSRATSGELQGLVADAPRPEGVGQYKP